ncbi:MAG: hypothetical protein U9R58_08675, partial [Chloroflexota bacterium]|nr:hypothetical protein [Chloroflexota bacterium]
TSHQISDIFSVVPIIPLIVTNILFYCRKCKPLLSNFQYESVQNFYALSVVWMFYWQLDAAG